MEQNKPVEKSQPVKEDNLFKHTGFSGRKTSVLENQCASIRNYRNLYVNGKQPLYAIRLQMKSFFGAMFSLFKTEISFKFSINLQVVFSLKFEPCTTTIESRHT